MSTIYFPILTRGQGKGRGTEKKSIQKNIWVAPEANESLERIAKEQGFGAFSGWVKSLIQRELIELGHTVITKVEP